VNVPQKPPRKESGARVIAEGGGKIRIGANCIIPEYAALRANQDQVLSARSADVRDNGHLRSGYSRGPRTDIPGTTR